MKMCRDMNVIVFYTIKETFSFKGLKYEIPGKVHEENRRFRSVVGLVNTPNEKKIHYYLHISRFL